MEEIDRQKAPGDQKHGSSPHDQASSHLIDDPSSDKPSFNHYWRVFALSGKVEFALLGVSVTAAIASGIGIGLQNLIFGRFVTTITDFSSGKSSAEHLRHDSASLALDFLYLAIGRFVLSYVYNSLLTLNAYRLVRNIRLAYLKAALQQEIAYFDLGTSGSMSTQITSNGRLIERGISEKLGLTVQGLAAFIAAFSVAFATSWKLTLITLCIAPATLIAMGSAGTFAAGYEQRILDIVSKANAFAEDILSSSRLVHAFDMSTRLVDRFDAYLVEAHRVGAKMSPFFGILFSSTYTIMFLGYSLAFWQGIHRLASGEIGDPGQIFTVLLSVTIGSMSLTNLAPHSIDFTRAASAAAQLFTLIDRGPAIDPMSSNGERPTEIVGHLQLENVSFSYPTRRQTPILNNLSLDISPGKVTALVGPSGCGKSTIVGLIERWYDPTQGTIKLDRRPINELNLRWLRTNIRLVQQEPILFQGSVFDNIANGLIGTVMEKASREEQRTYVEKAAKIAYAHDFITALTDGYDTDVGERGSFLSGGQKQRIAIARSIVSNPRVLLLDEATSALDPEAETIVQKALDEASRGRTTLVVAHKLATIQKSDNIVVIESGSVVEQGTHVTLLAQQGAYARLVHNQKLSLSPSDTESPQGDENPSLIRTSQHSRHLSKETECPRNVDERYNYAGHREISLLRAIKRLIVTSPQLKWTMLVLALACIASSLAYPGQAILLANLVEVFTLTGPKFLERGDFFAAMFVVLAGGCLVSYFAMGYSANTIAQELSHKIRRQMLEDILRQDLDFFDLPENHTGALSSRLDAHTHAILEMMGFNLGLVLIAVLNITISSVLGIVYSWKLGLVVVFAGLPPLVGSGWLNTILDVRLNNYVSRQQSLCASIASEAISSIRTVSSLAMEQLILDRYSARANDALSWSSKRLFGAMFFFALTQSMEYLFMSLGFWFGCRLLSFGEISLYDFFVTFMAVFFSGQATSQMFQFSSNMTKGKVAVNYVFWLRDLQPTIEETSQNQPQGPSPSNNIAFDHVRFSYPHRPQTLVLKGLDLEIKCGQSVAFVGPSGCGKSTVIAMLERFYDPQTGSVRIGNQTLANLNPRLYRQSVSLVQQEPALFQGSIRDNVSLGMADLHGPKSIPPHPNTSDDRIEAALRAANAWEFVSSLPEGLATQTGPRGTQLSGGQRQRIAIARALIREPAVLLLDEATSALDTQTEKMLQESLANAANVRGRITVAVAHRLSTVKEADVIFVLSGGRIVESGNHLTLLSLGGMYKRMCQAQELDQ